MANKEKPKMLIHVDVDSPIKLLSFYQIQSIPYTQKELENFYVTSWDRALRFFEEHNIRATFFVVGNELENSDVIKEVILKAHKAGHEIENHTYSHPYGLVSLSDEEIATELTKCNQIVECITGRRPIGFRSPGYSMKTSIMNLLEGLNFKYDSSGFWSIMNPIFQNVYKYILKNGVKNEGFGHVDSSLKQTPYIPNKNNWLKNEEGNRTLVELPLPRTRFYMPFYNNFNLWTPSVYNNLVCKTINKPLLVYLFHIIEFMDLSDNIPEQLKVHPGLKIPLNKKLSSYSNIIKSLTKRYDIIKTEDFVNNFVVKK